MRYRLYDSDGHSMSKKTSVFSKDRLSGCVGFLGK